MWVANSLDDSVTRIDPGTGSATTTIRIGRSPAGVAIGAGSVWVADGGDGTVTRIDPNTDRVIATIAVGGSPKAITVADGRVWVTVDAQTIKPTDVASSGGTLRVDSPLGSMLSIRRSGAVPSRGKCSTRYARSFSTIRSSLDWRARN